MKHDAIEDELVIRLLLLADSMDGDRYPDADLIRSAVHRIEHLTALTHSNLRIDLDDVVTTSERLLASERNFYAERAKRAEAGWAEVEGGLHANEVAFDEDTNAAVDELNRWRERALAAAEDADRLAGCLAEAWAEDTDERDDLGLPLIWTRYQEARIAHDEAMKLWFCPEHGGPIDDCEQCIDERETANDQVLDEDWPKIVEFD